MNRKPGSRKRKIAILLLLLVISLLVIVMRGCNRNPSDLSSEPIINLYLSQEKRVIQIGLEEYITGSVAAEMPSSFPLEALKAQAVCARTYALRKVYERHSYPKGADLTDDITNCQAYISRKEFIKRHPYKYEELIKRIETAVAATRGEILTYQNKPIDALYHSTCGGTTESARDAWGQDIPYLQARECKYCEASKYYETVQVFSSQELSSIFPGYKGTAGSIKISARSKTGRVKSIQIADHIYSAAKIREILQLPSTWWDLKTEKGEVTVISKGYGHGVGMCQYGAGGMAEEGKSYKQVLEYYFPHTKLTRLNYDK